MQPPIIVDGEGDVLLFDSVKKAEQYLEPIDVRNNRYVVYDAEGRILRGEIVRQFLAVRVKLVPVSEAGAATAALRHVLIEFLRRTGGSSRKLEELSLQELFSEMMRFRIG